jgi:uncharacterized protein (DUF1800 family)
LVVSVPVYSGEFGVPQAERLLWRAGFGPAPGEAAAVAGQGLQAAVHSLTRPPAARLSGPAPVDDDGRPIQPKKTPGHDVLWWLDRMVRSNQPLVERMTLIWHDWFATGDVGSQALTLRQNQLFRAHALGSFADLFRAVTVDPAMLLWLNGIGNSKGAPNENYAREMMELFSLGVSDEAGYPYSEQDVREQARALTGWRANSVANADFRFDPGRHDAARKTIFAQSGNFTWEDSCRLCVEHAAHPPYFIERLWRQFLPEPPDEATRRALEFRYRRGSYEVRPMVEAILMHPRFYEGPALVKPPVVFIAGMLRARQRGIDTADWAYYCKRAGMRPFRPPNVAGWDESRWLDTSTYKGRWESVARLLQDEHVAASPGYDPTESPELAVGRALRFWADPAISAPTRRQLLEYAQTVAGSTSGQSASLRRALRQNGLRALVASAPDLQAC